MLPKCSRACEDVGCGSSSVCWVYTINQSAVGELPATCSAHILGPFPTRCGLSDMTGDYRSLASACASVRVETLNT